jgi:hypothetical protein
MALNDVAQSRLENAEVTRLDTQPLPVKHVPPQNHDAEATCLYPSYVSAAHRRITYLVLALEHETQQIVVRKMRVSACATWTILACYVEDPTAAESMEGLAQTLMPASRCGKVAAFLELNASESDLFLYTDIKLANAYCKALQ